MESAIDNQPKRQDDTDANKTAETLSAGMTKSAPTRNRLNLLMELMEVVMVVPNLIRAENIIGNKRHSPRQVTLSPVAVGRRH